MPRREREKKRYRESARCPLPSRRPRPASEGMAEEEETRGGGTALLLRRRRDEEEGMRHRRRREEWRRRRGGGGWGELSAQYGWYVETETGRAGAAGMGMRGSSSHGASRFRS